MLPRIWKWLGRAVVFGGLLVILGANPLLADRKMIAMPANVLIEWNKEGGDLAESATSVPDITVFADGRLRFGPRLGGGEIIWRQLPDNELEALRHFVFEEQTVMDIEDDTLSRDVRAAVARRSAATDSAAVRVTAAPQMDASTTVLRVAEAGRAHEVRYYDLFGDAQRYPEIEGLQRLRTIELRMLQLAEEHAAQQ